MTDSRRKLYQIDESSAQQMGSVTRSKAKIISTGTEVFFHRIQIDESILNAEDLFSHINTFCKIRDPRVPMVMDGWQDKDAVEFVLLEQEGDPLNSKEARHTMKTLERNYGFEMTYQSLAALASLHNQNATHRKINKEAFIVHSTGMIFLKNAGIIDRINKIIADEKGEGVVQGTSFVLASNLSGFDVADWACMVASILMGVPVLDPSDRPDDDIVQPETVAMAQKEISKAMNDNAISKFLVKCLQSRADTVGGFDNAADALKNFPIEEASK